ncbi:hypothetical protein Nepgr_001078 [Nepenthes gracilis]|uniref:Uncharacterized protein n=1 Tax=Nepenthes gracilis TaxID=150966 RepID=A0AAD3RWP7_NEPGR|nr:hypothetical protein Nepgr_001078 [Nepenthes gracilis]
MEDDHHRHSEHDRLFTEIVNRGIQDGSQSFSVRVGHRGLPNFVNSVNLKYVKLGYTHLVRHGFYLVIAPLFVVILAVKLGRIMGCDVSGLLRTDLTNALYFVGPLCLLLYVYFDLLPRPTYLVDFACYCPPHEFQVSYSKNVVEKIQRIERRVSGNLFKPTFPLSQTSAYCSQDAFPIYGLQYPLCTSLSEKSASVEESFLFGSVATWKRTLRFDMLRLFEYFHWLKSITL